MPINRRTLLLRDTNSTLVILGKSSQDNLQMDYCVERSLNAVVRVSDVRLLNLCFKTAHLIIEVALTPGIDASCLSPVSQGEVK